MMTTSPLDDLARSRGIELHELTRAGVVSPGTIYRMRRGRPVRPSSVRRLADALDVPVADVADAIIAAADR